MALVNNPRSINGIGRTSGTSMTKTATTSSSAKTFPKSRISKKGFGYFKRYVSPAAFLLPINILEDFTKPLSLSFRLFGNILADELVVGVLITLVPLIIPIPLILLGVFTSAIQALVFATLAGAYIGEAVEQHHLIATNFSLIYKLNTKIIYFYESIGFFVVRHCRKYFGRSRRNRSRTWTRNSCRVRNRRYCTSTRSGR
jgi:hypothetical protein